MPSAEDAAPATAVLYRQLGRVYPVAARAEGVFIYDDAGRRYLDAASGALVVNVGHGRREVGEAFARQAACVAFAHTSQFTTAAQEELARRIAALAPGDLDHVAFASGGSEAVETALKLARQYHVERGASSRGGVIARWSSYHGATLGALAASGHTGRRKPFLPLLPPATHIPPPYCYRCPLGASYPGCAVRCAEALEAAILREGEENVAAFIAEPVGGAAAGALTPPPEYYPRVRQICDRYGVLFVADEVMCGAGRTGRWAAIERWGVVPDVLVLGKGLASGYAPLAAVVVREEVYAALSGGSGRLWHGFTYSGHAPSCAAGLAVLDIVEREGLIERAAAMGSRLRERLEGLRARHPTIGDVRGEGLLLALELVRDRESGAPFPPAVQLAVRLGAAAFARGLILYPGSGGIDGLRGDHVLIGPPFVIAEGELDLLVALLSEALAAVESEGLSVVDSRIS